MDCAKRKHNLESSGKHHWFKPFKVFRMTAAS